MNTILAVIIFLLVKTFQYANAFILNYLTNKHADYMVMIYALLFIAALVIFGTIIERFFPKLRKGGWLIIIITLIGAILMNPVLFVSFLVSLFLYAMIGAEAQVFRSFSEYKKIPRTVLLLPSMIPVAAYFVIPEASSLGANILYVTVLVFAFLNSYSVKKYQKEELGAKGSQSSPWLGFFFMIGSLVLYHISQEGEIIDSGEVTPVLLAVFFYICGALIVYTSVNAKITEEGELKKRKEINDSLKNF